MSSAAPSEIVLSIDTASNIVKSETDLESGEKTRTFEPAEDDDFRTHRQEFKGWTLLWLSLQSIGTVYGDIGTSPLYVYSATFDDVPPNGEEILGALSLILWCLFLVVTVKYVIVTLRADDAGEGGTFALYSLLARYAHIEDREPGKPARVMDRYATVELPSTIRAIRNAFERKRLLRLCIRLAAIFGVCCILADGIFTPAQSVLGAIQGIRVRSPSLSSSAIVGASCGILIFLFALQPLGINRLATWYAPIIVLWLLFNASSGIYNLVKHDAGVFRAFNPVYAGRHVFQRQSGRSLESVYGILLSFTGCEALFADLGSFSRHSIQLSWVFFVWPCLMLTYLGQAAHVREIPASYSNPFFFTLPPGCFWPGLILSVFAAIVASQAMITGVFQILSQAMALCYFPRIRINFTSTLVHNQCYVPLANWLLMIGCIIVTAVFNNTTALGNAYGLCVILVSFITTILLTLVAIIVWRQRPLLVVMPLSLLCLLFDGFWVAIATLKIPKGAWVTLVIACVLACFMIIWRTGKSMQWRAEAASLQEVRSLVRPDQEYITLEGTGVFFDETDSDIPPIYSYWLQTFRARHKVTLFAHMRQVYHPTIAPEERFRITRVGSLPYAYRVLIRYGYNEHEAGLHAASTLPEHVLCHLKKQLDQCAIGSERCERLKAEVKTLQVAQAEKEPIFLFGRKDIQVSPDDTNVLRKALVRVYAIIRDAMTDKAKLWSMPSDKIVELGNAVVI